MSRARLFIVAAVVLALAAPARAQTSTAFDAQQFHPSITSNGYYTVDGAFVARHLGFSAGVWGSYGHDPLVLRRDGALAGELIVRQLGLDVVGSFAFVDRIEIGIDLPIVPYQVNDNSLANLPRLKGAGLGDLAVEVKGLLWAPVRGQHRFGLAAVVGATFPTGDSDSFMGQGFPTGRFRLVGEWRARHVEAAVNAGFVVRRGRDFLDLHVGSQFAWGVALGVPLPRGFAVIGEVRGLVGIEFPKGASLDRSEAPSELAVGLRWRARFGLELNLAAGVGLTRGYGTPDRARAIFGIKYVSPERRQEAVATATSPRLPPPLPAPIAPPPPPIVVTPPPPAPDSDRDGVADADDRCRDKPGPKENQGCPDFDSDGDGFIDRQDKCPFEPETFNGVDDEDGCPDQPAALAGFHGDKIVIFEPVLFEKDGSVVDRRSYKLLGVVAHLLRLHPEILKLRVEGHMDNKMPPYEGLELSRARAAAVRRWLVDQGKVEAKRLTAQGFGPDRPLADNRDFIGRAKNRRIEFVIMQRLDAGN